MATINDPWWVDQGIVRPWAEAAVSSVTAGTARFGTEATYTVPVDQYAGLYLMLFHGRESPQHNLEDWGSEGPIFGPLAYVQTTYGRHVKLGYLNQEANARDLYVYYDLIYYDGVYYGDWSVFHSALVTFAQRDRIVLYEEEKAKPRAT